MLQFITNANDIPTLLDQVKNAIDGGCNWIQLRMKGASYQQQKKAAEAIIPICRDADTILIIDDNVELVNELKVHGVHLGKNDMPVAKARELLGPGAIIGATANTADDILALKGIDVDYVGLGPFRFTTTKANLSPILGIEGYKKVIKTIRQAGCELPIVAIGGISIDDIASIMSTGVQGIAMSGAITNADNPTKYVADTISKLQTYKY